MQTMYDVWVDVKDAKLLAVFAVKKQAKAVAYSFGLGCPLCPLLTEKQVSDGEY